MKHWDGRDLPEAIELRVPRPERQRLMAMLKEPPTARREPPQVGAVIGLVLALGLVIGLAFLLAPADPVSAKLLD
jgi:hypothetical protein